MRALRVLIATGLLWGLLHAQPSHGQEVSQQVRDALTAGQTCSSASACEEAAETVGRLMASDAEPAQVRHQLIDYYVKFWGRAVSALNKSGDKQKALATARELYKVVAQHADGGKHFHVVTNNLLAVTVYAHLLLEAQEFTELERVLAQVRPWVRSALATFKSRDRSDPNDPATKLLVEYGRFENVLFRLAVQQIKALPVDAADGEQKAFRIADGAIAALASIGSGTSHQANSEMLKDVRRDRESARAAVLARQQGTQEPVAPASGESEVDDEEAFWGAVLDDATARKTGHNFDLLNESAAQVVGFYASPASSKSWGQNLLVGTLGSKKRQEMKVPRAGEECTYDLRAVLRDGRKPTLRSNVCGKIYNPVRVLPDGRLVEGHPPPEMPMDLIREGQR